MVRKEALKLLDACMIYAISDSSWVSPVQVVSKKGGILVVKNDNNELILTRTTTGCAWVIGNLIKHPIRITFITFY